jgi:hypothetical protein
MQKNPKQEKIEREELHKHIATYSYWITWGLILALFLLTIILFNNYYKLNSAIEVLWNNTFNKVITSH